LGHSRPSLTFVAFTPVVSEGIEQLVSRLDGFDAGERRQALEALVRLADCRGRRERTEVNLHCHTFFSYNAYGFSPSRFAWEAFRYGLEVAGIVDFDVLDGVEEFLEAGRLLRLKTVAGFETRVYCRELRDKVTNSPHEPGVSYLITTGFAGLPDAGSPAARTLQGMAECARRRNCTMLERINTYLGPVTVDYERDVLPLTPAGNATERHMLVAYEERARQVFPQECELARFWSDKLAEPLKNIRRLLKDRVGFRNLMRVRLMKYGGVGYTPPEEGSFPPLEEVVEMTLGCGAVPSGGWLDGTNDGEADAEGLFRLWLSKGLICVTIIPDRNWNLKDAREKALKVQKLTEAVNTARRLDMPILVGTEMNADGQKFVDTFGAAELEPHRQAFLSGARFAWGHTLLKMTAGIGCTGPWAERHFGDDRARRNAFFEQVGAFPYPGDGVMERLAGVGSECAPRSVLDILKG